MRQLVESIFGVYSPNLTAFYDETGQYVGDVVAAGAAGVDWQYICGVLLFGIALWCTLRMIEAVIRSL